MRFLFTVIIVLLFVQLNHAQKGIDGLVNAEKTFAAYSVTNGTKEAFLKFLDSTGIIFENGKPVNGIDAWTKREKRPGVLNWWPQFVEISKSNDFGYTSGPWTFRNSLNDTVIARGRFTTIWHINDKGEWKFLIDLGVQNTPVDTSTEIWDRTKSLTKKGTLKSLLKRESQFIKENADSAKGGYMIQRNGGVYFNAMNGISVLNRNGMEPQEGSWKNNAFPENVQYRVLGSGIAQSGDLGYVYGATIINGKTDNYLRIWRREKEGWKIALEVLRY